MLASYRIVILGLLVCFVAGCQRGSSPPPSEKDVSSSDKAVQQPATTAQKEVSGNRATAEVRALAAQKRCLKSCRRG